MIPTHNTTSAMGRGNDDDHFNLWDYEAARIVGSGESSGEVQSDIKPSSNGGGSNVIVNGSGVSWSAQSVLAACEGLTWPKWVAGFRPWQLQAVAEILNLYQRGIGVVLLDAPTGTGKTLIGEMSRKLQKVAGLYVCSGLELQDQFMRDFGVEEVGYVAKMLKGRANYPTINMATRWPEYSCADCTKERGDVKSCTYCPNTNSCPYAVAKSQALGSELAVLNTTYLLYEANHAGRFSEQDFTILDEADLVESELMRFVELRIPAKTLSECGVEGAKKGIHKPTLKRWMEDELIPGLEDRIEVLEKRGDDEARKRRKTLEGYLTSALRIVDQIESENWIRDYEAKWDPKQRREVELDSFIMRPVTVGDVGRENLWRHSSKWLVMSATIVSAQQMVKDLGIPGNRGEAGGWEVVSVPMQFPVEHRPIVLAGVANMTRKTEVEERPKMAAGLGEILTHHAEDNVLIHTNSYALTRWLADELSHHPRAKEILSYATSRERGPILSKYKKEGGILLGPSLDRGVDLPGELCRVMVIAKTPFPNLGDKQVSTRSHLNDGSIWYAVQTVRTIIQMTGRGVRNMDDYAVTYILDKQFTGKVWKDRADMFPQWWKDGVKEGLNGEYGKLARRIMS